MKPKKGAVSWLEEVASWSNERYAILFLLFLEQRLN